MPIICFRPCIKLIFHKRPIIPAVRKLFACLIKFVSDPWESYKRIMSFLSYWIFISGLGCNNYLKEVPFDLSRLKSGSFQTSIAPTPRKGYDTHSQNWYSRWGRRFYFKVAAESFPSWHTIRGGHSFRIRFLFHCPSLLTIDRSPYSYTNFCPLSMGKYHLIHGPDLWYVLHILDQNFLPRVLSNHLAE